VGAAAETTVVETTDQPAVVVEEAFCEMSGLKIVRCDTKRLFDPHDLRNLEAELKKLGPSDGKIEDSDPLAVVVRPGGDLKLDSCVVTAVNGAGCGVENADLKLTRCQIIDCGLMGVVASAGATISIEKCEILNSGMIALTADRTKHVRISESRLSQANMIISLGPGDMNIDHCEFDHGRLGMLLCDSRVIVRHCRIHDCETGVLCTGASTGLFTECELSAITFQAFKIEESASVRLASNQSADAKLHVVVSGSAAPMIESCSFSGGSIGVVVTENANVTVTSSSFEDCRCALQTNDQGELSVENSSIASTAESALRIYSRGKAAALLCRIENCQVGVGCGEATEVEISGCSINRCRMAAVVAEPGASVTIHNSSLVDNQGGIGARGATLRITDSIVERNQTNGVVARETVLDLSECRIAENEAGVIVIEKSTLRYLEPSIVENNKEGQWWIDNDSTIEGVLTAEEANALSEALRNDQLDAADETVIKAMRRVAGVEYFDTQEKVNKIPEIFLRFIFQIWQRSGRGFIFERDWIIIGREGVLKGRFFSPTWLCKRFWDLYL
jgi:hypothetical protein